MPPNLGGFFMVRSYYPSECHADYFDFERIEALKPAIEACGISTLSQSPMLGFHKQMDNRIKLLEEILSFRMQGVEFDNGDMYVDGHKACLRLLRVSGIVMRLRMFLLLITFLKASHSFRNRLLVICKNAYLFATMIMTSVSSPFSCCSGIVRLNLM